MDKKHPIPLLNEPLMAATKKMYSRHTILQIPQNVITFLEKVIYIKSALNEFQNLQYALVKSNCIQPLYFFIKKYHFIQ